MILTHVTACLPVVVTYYYNHIVYLVYCTIKSCCKVYTPRSASPPLLSSPTRCTRSDRGRRWVVRGGSFLFWPAPYSPPLGGAGGAVVVVVVRVFIVGRLAQPPAVVPCLERAKL